MIAVVTGPAKRRSWRHPPERDASGRLAPDVLAAARRKVRRGLLALIIVAIAAGLLAYACSRSTAHACCSPTPTNTATTGTATGTSPDCRNCPSPAPS